MNANDNKAGNEVQLEDVSSILGEWFNEGRKERLRFGVLKYIFSYIIPRPLSANGWNWNYQNPDIQAYSNFSTINSAPEQQEEV